MTTLLERPTAPVQQPYVNIVETDPRQVIVAAPGTYSPLEVAQAYFLLGERPIPLCDPNHAHVSANHVNGYRRKDGCVVPPCTSPGKAPLERDYPRFATVPPTRADIVRMFGTHQGNIGDVAQESRVVIDIDPRSGGLESIAALTGRYGPFPETPTARTGGNGLHLHLELPSDIGLPSGGSLAASGYPGVEWKGAGQQVVLAPSVHHSGRPYLWEPEFALGQLPIALVPDYLLQLILEQASNSGASHGGKSASVKYAVQPPQVQEHFAALWHQLGVEVLSGSGDQFFSCPFHQEEHPSLHVDAQRCIWYCFASQCPRHRGGGVRELEALVGPVNHAPLPAGLIFHVPEESASDEASELGNNSYPNSDSADPLLEELKARARDLFPVPEGQLPRVISRLCAFTQDPSRAFRKQVISNTWANPANRALKCRQYWAHLMHQLALSDVDALYEISISQDQWSTRKRESLAAQVSRRNGEYACFDNRATVGQVRFITNVSIPGAEPVGDIDIAIYEALRDVDLPDDAEQNQRTHLVWLSKGWSLPSHESKGTTKVIAYKKGVEPVDDAKEAEVAKAQGLETWLGTEGQLDEWGQPRYFAVPRERVAEVGLEKAFNELVQFATQLGYQSVWDPWGRICEARGESDVGTTVNDGQ